MGCASGKPTSHTQRPLHKHQPSSINANLNPTKENPELRNDPKPTTQKLIHPLPAQAIPSPQKSQAQPIKPIIEQSHKNEAIINHSPQKPNTLGYHDVKKTQNNPEKQLNQVTALPIQTPTKNQNNQTQSKKAELSAIPERTDEFESIKKTQLGYAESQKAEERKEQLRNSAKDQLRNSVPQMKEDFTVSKISKNNQSTEKIKNQSSTYKKMQLELDGSHEKNSLSHQKIDTDEIKINVIDNKNESRLLKSSKISSGGLDEFAVLNEEQFDLRCEFDPNTLVIDMNKVAW